MHGRQHGGAEALQVADLSVGPTLEAQDGSGAIAPRVDQLDLGPPDVVGPVGPRGSSDPRGVEGEPGILPAEEDEAVQVEGLVLLADVGDVEEVEAEGHLRRPIRVGTQLQGVVGGRGIGRRRRAAGAGRAGALLAAAGANPTTTATTSTRRRIVRSPTMPHLSIDASRTGRPPRAPHLVRCPRHLMIGGLSRWRRQRCASL